MVKEKIKVNSWNEATWIKIVELAAKAARLSDVEKLKLGGSLAVELVAATAYFSGCTSPDRTAVAHLTTFIAAVRCPELYGHRKGESLQDRLSLGNYYPGGNPEAVKACMLILEMISINDHRNDFEDDLITGKANPLTTNINFDDTVDRIRKEFEQLNTAIKSRYQYLYDKAIKCGLWL